MFHRVYRYMITNITIAYNKVTGVPLSTKDECHDLEHILVEEPNVMIVSVEFVILYFKIINFTCGITLFV